MRSLVIATRGRGKSADDRHASPDPHRLSRGQSLVEFTLLLPVLLILIVGILDFARVFTSMVTVESAAREAADFGAFNLRNWSGNRASDSSNYQLTLAAMQQRACVASSNLTDYDPGDGSGCANPFHPDGWDGSVILVDPVDGDNTDCHELGRATPCRVRVDLEYQFDTIIPLGIDLFGARLGLPDDPSFTRSSTFAVADFELDEP